MTAPFALLRPLNVGEIFDRAVTLYVKNFVTFTLIALTVLAPYGVATYFFAPDQGTQLQQIFDAASKPTSKQAPQPDPFAGYTVEKGVGFALSILLFLLLAPFSSSAVALGVAALYSGKRPDYRASYVRAFSRWPQVLGVGFMAFLIFVGVYIAFVFIFGLAIIAGAAATQSALPLAILLFILAGVVLLVFLTALILIFLVMTFAFYSVVIERVGVIAAIGASFSRVFNRKEFWKAVLIALAAIAFQFGVSSIVGTIGIVLLLFMHNSIPNIVLSVLTNAIITGFITVLLAVYYYDVRTRREGLDLEVQLQGLTTG